MGDEPRVRPTLTLKAAPAAAAPQGARMRADLLLVEKKLVRNRYRAATEIEAGNVFAGDVKIEKPGDLVDVTMPISLKQRHNPYVSRGGLKLAHALDHFGINPEKKICVDLGAGQGGFAQVLAERGAARVYAVEQAVGMLGDALHLNPIVINLEGMDARALSRRQIPEHVDIITVDLGGLPLAQGVGAALSLAAKDAVLLALVSLDAEAGRGRPPRGRGPAVAAPGHALTPREISARLDAFLKTNAGFAVAGLVESPVRGAGQPREVFILAKRV